MACLYIAWQGEVTVQSFDIGFFPDKKFNKSVRRVEKGAFIGHVNEDWYEETDEFKAAKKAYEAETDYFLKTRLLPFVAFLSFCLLTIISLVRTFTRRRRKWYVFIEVFLAGVVFLGAFVAMVYRFPELDTLIYRHSGDVGFRDSYKWGSMVSLGWSGIMSAVTGLGAFLLMVVLYIVAVATQKRRQA